MTRILGIDPGLRRMGWAVLDCEGSRYFAVASGTCLSESKAGLAERLAGLLLQLDRVIGEYAPDEVAVEETFVNKDAVATLKLGQARAVALLAGARAGLLVAEYFPNMVKKTVVGAGHADKSQVDYMVRLQISGAKPEGADAADAYAIALCHAFQRRARIVA